VPRARLLLASLLLLATAVPALAQGLPGIGAAPTAGAAPGWLAQLYAWINLQQGLLRRELAELLGGLKAGEAGAFWGLLGGSFLYGVLHAAGPGHGKLVISGYLFANRSQLKAGLWLTLVSSLLQAVAALLLVGGFALLLDQARLTVTRNVYLLEILSYALIVLLGLVLLWRALRGQGHDHGHDHHDHDHHDHHDQAHAQVHHAHAWTPPAAAIPRRDFWALALSVGIRPCSGAVIVLLFTLGQGLFIAGTAATFAMAAGTALTVGVLAALAVGSRGLAERLAGRRGGAWVGRLAGVLGALLIVVLGALLLWTTWSEPPSV
jgi:nickel/cobalt exporter